MGNIREGMIYEVDPGHREIRLFGRTILRDTPNNIFGFSRKIGRYKAKKPHGFKPRDIVLVEMDEGGEIRSMEKIGRAGWLAHNLLLIWIMGLLVAVALIISIVR